MNTFNGGFNNARSINAGSLLQSNVQTNKDQGQELSTLDDGCKNKPTQPVISFVIPSYASGITHLLDLNGKLPKIPIPSDELLPPIGLKSPINNDNEINSRTLSPTEPQALPNFIGTTTWPSFPITDNKNYNLPNATLVSLSSKTNTEATATPVTVRPIKKLTVANFNSLFQTTGLATTPTIESTTSAIPRIFLTTESSETQNTTEISQQNLSSTENLQETTALSPESWRRLIILGEQRTPGYAVRSDGSIDSNIAFPYTTALPTINVPSFEIEKRPITTATTSLPETTPSNLNDNPPLPVQSSVVKNQFDTQNGIFNKKSNELSKPRVNNLFQTTHSPLFANNIFSTSTNSEPLRYTNPSNSFDAFKFTVSGFQKSTSSSSIVRNDPTNAPFFAKTTNAGSIFTATKTTSNPVLKANPNASTLNEFATNFASNVSIAQQPKVPNGFELSKNIPVPDNNPFLPPLAPVKGITITNFTFKNQVTIRNGIAINENPIKLINPENSPSTVNHLASSTEKSIIDSYPSTSKQFTASDFRSSNNSSNNQTFDNPITTLTDRISNSKQITTTETTISTLIEKATIQPTSQTLSTFFEPVTDSIVETPLNDLLPPNFPNNDLLPPLSSESSINVIKNDTTHSSLEIMKSPFLPTLDLNPFLAPFSSNLAHTVPQQISSIPSVDVSTTTKPNTQSNFPSKFDNNALRNNFFATPITQANNFKYTGGFGAPSGILSPRLKNLNK